MLIAAKFDRVDILVSLQLNLVLPLPQIAILIKSFYHSNATGDLLSLFRVKLNLKNNGSLQHKCGKRFPLNPKVSLNHIGNESHRCLDLPNFLSVMEIIDHNVKLIRHNGEFALLFYLHHFVITLR